MRHGSIIRVQDVMKRQFDRMDGMTTVRDALLAMKHPETRSIIVERRDDDDEFGLVLIADIAKKVLAADRSPERVNLYEIMAKPVLGVAPQMRIHHCARLLERFSIMRAPVIQDRNVIGIVSYHDLVLQGLLRQIKAAEEAERP